MFLIDQILIERTKKIKKIKTFKVHVPHNQFYIYKI